MNARHQEVINRIEYMYKDVDGNINFPNSFDGDVLKIAYKSAKASLVHLNDNQQIVLQWLKLTAPTGKPMQVVFWMMNNAAWGHLDELRDPLMELTDKQQFEVLAAFAQWGLEQEEAE
ncbi:hypothetical protein P6Z28_01775 [Enterococcus faecium]|uniref:hypothetical protein n=1 Tax=Enterococcus faecium TaxID=1352 RepID=UPI0021E8C278|nr:hypothetical protein [Enterococcus faecium]MCV3117386.1 hypothetical protein [Enterococcus faecium]MDT2271356.1 hypothetical protein [Enterococcus faecium]